MLKKKSVNHSIFIKKRSFLGLLSRLCEEWVLILADLSTKNVPRNDFISRNPNVTKLPRNDIFFNKIKVLCAFLEVCYY